MSTSKNNINNLNGSSHLRTLEVAFTPGLLPFFDFKGKTVVVIDIFRASSAICTALAHGIKEIIPVQDLEDAVLYRNQGYIVAAERKGEIVPGFKIGNSPFSFMDESLKGKTIVLTTTNCTKAIYYCEEASQILIGSFINISAIARYLQKIEGDVLLLCAGWKNRFNLEDTIFAGALVERLRSHFTIECDSAIAATHLYNVAKNDIRGFLKSSSHSQRLSHLHIEEDINYCLTPDQADVVPSFNGTSIVSLNHILV